MVVGLKSEKAAAFGWNLQPAIPRTLTAIVANIKIRRAAS
jgi:hypothetical protein